MYLQDFIADKGELLESAMKHPALSPKRKPTIDQALKAVVSEIEQSAAKNVAAILIPQLNDMYEMYVMLNGEHDDCPDQPTRDDYESALDDEVESIFDPFQKHLSANWLATNTIDTRLYEEGTIEKLALSAGREVVKQLSSVTVQEQNQGIASKTPAQILANAGIVQTDVQLYLDQHLAPKEAGDAEMSTDETDDAIKGVIEKMRAHIGTGFDMIEVYSDVELALDDDEILANGAGARLGLDETDVGHLQTLTFLHDASDVPNVIMAMLDDTPDKTKPAKAERKAKDPVVPKQPPAMGEEAAEVLDLIVSHSAVNDTAMAAAIGVSRATFNNYKARKTEFKPDEMQKTILRDQIVKDLNGLYRAMCLIDDVAVDREFE